MTGLTALVLLVVATPVPTRLTADVDDVFSLRTNPAGLGAMDSSESRLLYGYEGRTGIPDQRDVHAVGLYGGLRLGALSLGAGADFGFPAEGGARERGLLGLALGTEQGSLGLGIEHLDPDGLGGDTLVRAGLQTKPSRWVSVGGAVQDIGETFGPRDWDLGLGIRPGTERIQVSTQWRITEDEPLNSDTLDLQFLLRLEPIPGLTLGFAFDHDFDRFNGQMAFDFGRTGSEVGVLRSPDAQGDTATSLSVSTVVRAKPVPSLVTPRTFVQMELAGELVPPPSFNPFAGGFQAGVYGWAPMALEQAAHSKSVAGLMVRISDLQIGWAKAEELRAGIEKVVARGKPVSCFLEGTRPRDVFLASACTDVVMLPVGILDVSGVSAQVVNLGDTLNRFGIDVRAVKRGRYKTAPERFTESKPSEAAVETIDALLDEFYASWTAGLEDRLSESQVTELVARGVATATVATDRQLVDAVLYRDEFEDWVRKRHGSFFIRGVDELQRKDRPRWGPGPQVAVVYIDAAIASGESFRLPFGLGTTSGADTVVRALEQARRDGTVKAVVLRIDTPGGDAIASDRIAHAVKVLAEDKPVVVSMGDVAASGGYYAAAPATAIFAEPTTITGSIGVFSLQVSINRLLTRFGVNVTQFERGEHSGGRSLLAPLDPADASVVRGQVEFLYSRFVDVVAEHRNLTRERVLEVAEGRVWSGRAALNKGLVDRIGGMADAIRHAQELAELGGREVDLVVLPASRKPLPEVVRKLDRPAPESTDALPAWLPGRFRKILAAALVAGQGPAALPEVWVQVD